MSDIFISYAREDQSRAEMLAYALEHLGWSVWWDRAIPAGRTFAEVIKEKIDATRCVVVLWSKAAAASDWVRDEAEEGKQSKILVPVLIESTEIPMGYRQIQTADLVDWTGDVSAVKFQRLVRDISAILGPPPPPPPPPPKPQPQPPWKLWAAIAVALGVTLVAFGWRWFSKSESTPSPPPVTGVGPGPGETIQDCDVCPEMVVVAADSFMMGSPKREAGRGDNEGPQHKVSIGRFALGKHEVTRREFAAFAQIGVIQANGCQIWDGQSWQTDDSKSWRDPGFPQTDNDPVVCVSWEDAEKYTDWLSLKTSFQYRLASESEWEYAARAKTTIPRFWGNNPNKACGFANVADRTLKESAPRFEWTFHDCHDGYMGTAPVGSFQVNGFGLRDMLGNVWEWTMDCWNGDYSGAPSDGSSRVTGECSFRVARGGSWYGGPGSVRAAKRYKRYAGSRDGDIGFRVAREIR